MICSFERGPLKAQSSTIGCYDCTRRLRHDPTGGAAERSARSKDPVTWHRQAHEADVGAAEGNRQSEQRGTQVQRLPSCSPLFHYAWADLAKRGWEGFESQSAYGDHRGPSFTRLERRFHELRRVQSKSPRDKRHTIYVYYVLLYLSSVNHALLFLFSLFLLRAIAVKPSGEKVIVK